MAEIPQPAETALKDGVPSPSPVAENQQRSQTLIEALPDAILVHSENKIVFVNPFCVRLLGAEGAEQLIGRDMLEIVHPDHVPFIKSRIQECYSSGTASTPMEATVIASDGSLVEIEAVAVPILWNGSPALEVVIRDIRKRKHAQLAAHEWQKRLELAQRTGLRIGLWDWNLTANTVVWSEESYRQFGYTRETFSGRVEDALSRIHPEDRKRVETAIGQVMAGAVEYAAQYRLVHPDGTICWIDAHGVMIRNGSTHMLGIGVDITNHKNIELSLQESEEKYLRLLNSTAEAIYGLDLQGNCTFCNPSCVRLLGYTAPEDLLQKNMHALIHHTRGDGTPYPAPACEIYAAVREGIATHVTDEMLWRADRTSFPAEYWSYPLYKAGELVGAVVTFLDISNRKQAELALRQSEEKYRKLFENATYGIFRSTIDGTLLDVNPALVTMLGYGSKGELLARNLNRDIYEHSDDRISILDRCEPSGRVDGAEVKWKRKDGKIIDVRLSGGVGRTEDGRVTHFEVVVENITRRRSLEAQFRQAQKMEAVGLLAGGISHDFNNLLSVILGNADLLLETPLNSVQQHYAEAIKKATGRAAQLTRQLLAFSRKQLLYPTVLDLNSVVGDVGKILLRLIGEDIQIVIDLQAHLGSIRADRGQIEQILMNLATNSRDAMPTGGIFTIRTQNVQLGEIDVARYPYVKPGRYIRLSVTDTGAGMSEEVRSHIFEPFFTTKPEGRGTGLGLATVYGIVKQSGGFIWSSSAPGAGATFDICLPRVDEIAQAPLPDLAIRTQYPRGTETILLLEDEASLRQVTCEFLTASGYSVLEAGRGDRAIEVAQRHKGSIPLMISDVVLPDMRGPAIVSKIQALHPETKVLYVSGYAEVPVAQQLVADGAVLLQKPLSHSELMKKVDEMLHPGISPVRGNPLPHTHSTK